jgi:hypothetical protein
MHWWRSDHGHDDATGRRWNPSAEEVRPRAIGERTAALCMRDIAVIAGAASAPCSAASEAAPEARRSAPPARGRSPRRRTGSRSQRGSWQWAILVTTPTWVLLDSLAASRRTYVRRHLHLGWDTTLPPDVFLPAGARAGAPWLSGLRAADGSCVPSLPQRPRGRRPRGCRPCRGPQTVLLGAFGSSTRDEPPVPEFGAVGVRLSSRRWVEIVGSRQGV